MCDQAESKWRDENISLDLKYRAEDGTSGFYNRVSYEYKKDKNRMLIIDDEDRYIFDWLLESYSIGKIIDKLEKKKIKTSKGKEWLAPY